MSDLCGADDILVLNRIADTSDSNISGVSGAGAGGGGGGGGAAEEGGGVRLGRVTSSEALELGRRLLAAARDGDTEAVLEHMAKGAPFTTDWLGTSPLHLAAANNRAPVCAVLLRAGVSRDCRTKVERTPLHLSAYWGHGDTTELLLRHGADPHACDMLGMTPLHWSAERGHVRCARALLGAGADPLALSRFHTTPLSLARALREGGGARGEELVSALEEALAAREAGHSVTTIQEDEPQSEEPDMTEFVTVEDATEIHQTTDDESIKYVQDDSETNASAEGAGAAGAGAGAGAAGGAVGAAGGEAEGEGARLLRAHGITLLPADEGTALSALRSGRTLLLSDAGKLMLKESSEKLPPPPPPGPATPAPPGTAGSSPVRLTATPVTTPPQGVKIFTLNSSTASHGREHSKMTIKKIIHSGNAVKYVALPSDAKIVSPKRVQVGKLKSVSGAGKSKSDGVKILLNKGNLHKLVHTQLNKPQLIEFDQIEQPAAAALPAPTHSRTQTQTHTQTRAPTVVVVPGAYLSSRDPRYLRARLLASHAQLAHATAELAAARDRLRRYETPD